MSRALRNLAIVVFILLWSFNSEALRYQIRWTAKTQAQIYEYEVASSRKFRNQDLVDSGATKNTQKSIDLPAGLYFYRHRMIDNKGQADSWSAPREIRLGSLGKLKIQKPSSAEVFESSSARTDIYSSWKGLDSASYYLARISSPGGKIRQIKSLNPWLLLKNLDAGAWTLRVTAFSRDKQKLDSDQTSFTINRLAPKAAEFVEPMDEQLIQSERPRPWRVLRSFKADSSTLVISPLKRGTKKKSMRIQLDSNQSKGTLPALPPGKFQLTIVDRVRGEDRSSNILITSSPDPLGQSRYNLGWRFRSQTGLVFGKVNHFNRYSQAYEKPSAHFPRPLIGLILSGEIHREWGFFSEFHSFVHEYNKPNQQKMEPFFPWQINLGASYKIALLEDSQLDFGVFMKRNHQYYEGFVPGFESLATPLHHYGLLVGWRTLLSRWSQKHGLEFMLHSKIPLFSSSPILARGNTYWLPDLRLQINYIKNLSLNWSYYLGVKGVAERISTGEREGQDRTEYYNTTLHAILGLDWKI